MPLDLSFLPFFEACCNSAAVVSLLLGVRSIRKGDRTRHKRLMLLAFVFSSLFLTAYLVYHFSGVPVRRFQGPSALRLVYLAVLLSHTLLAVLVLPLVLRTFYLAFKGRFEEHRKLAKWTLWIWLYVSVTGVLVYLTIYPLGFGVLEVTNK